MNGMIAGVKNVFSPKSCNSIIFLYEPIQEAQGHCKIKILELRLLESLQTKFHNLFPPLSELELWEIWILLSFVIDLIFLFASGFRATIRWGVHTFMKPFKQNIATNFSCVDVLTANSGIYHHLVSIVQRLLLH